MIDLPYTDEELVDRLITLTRAGNLKWVTYDTQSAKLVKLSAQINDNNWLILEKRYNTPANMSGRRMEVVLSLATNQPQNHVVCERHFQEPLCENLFQIVAGANDQSAIDTFVKLMQLHEKQTTAFECSDSTKGSH